MRVFVLEGDYLQVRITFDVQRLFAGLARKKLLERVLKNFKKRKKSGVIVYVALDLDWIWI